MTTRLVSLSAWLGLLVLAGSAVAGEGGTLTGEWGGDGLVAIFTAQGATFEAACAQGVVPSPVRPDAGGRFTTTGRFEFAHPGPQAADEDGRGGEAVFSGRVSGAVLSLSIRPAGGPPQAYELRRGVRPKLVRCL